MLFNGGILPFALPVLVQLHFSRFFAPSMPDILVFFEMSFPPLQPSRIYERVESNKII